MGGSKTASEVQKDAEKGRRWLPEGPGRLRKRSKRVPDRVNICGRSGRGIRRARKGMPQLVLGPQRGLRGPPGRAQDGSRRAQKTGQTAPDGPRRPSGRPQRASAGSELLPGALGDARELEARRKEVPEKARIDKILCVLRSFLRVGVLWSKWVVERWGGFRTGPKWPRGQRRSPQEGPGRPPKSAQWAPGEASERGWPRPEDEHFKPGLFWSENGAQRAPSLQPGPLGRRNEQAAGRTPGGVARALRKGYGARSAVARGLRGQKSCRPCR